MGVCSSGTVIKDRQDEHTRAKKSRLEGRASEEHQRAPPADPPLPFPADQRRGEEKNEKQAEERSQNNLTAEERDAYSRQIAAFGVEMMMRLKTMDVLVVGLQGVGMEAAKNLVLSGPRSLTIHDPTPASIADLGSNFFLSETDAKAGVPRDQAVVAGLKELNPRVTVRALFSGNNTMMDESSEKGLSGNMPSEKYILERMPLPGTGVLTEEIVGAFSVVLFAGSAHSREELLKWNSFCRTFKVQRADSFGQNTSVPQPIGFVSVATFGAMGYMFSDYGENHSIFDADGEPASMRAITNITNDKQAIVEIDDQGEMFVGLDVDDHSGWFQISGVKGMEAKDGSNINTAGLWKYAGAVQRESTQKKIVEVNGIKHEVVVKQKSRDPYRILTGDTSGFGKYMGGGTLTYKKKPIVKHYKSLQDAMLRPNLEMCDMSKWGRAEQLHVATQAVYDFRQQNGRLPADKQSDIEAVQAMATKYNATMKALQERLGYDAVLCVDEVDSDVVEKVARHALVELQPLGTFFGGMVAQEVMKWTGKFTPLNQMMAMDAFEVLPNEPPADIKPLGSGEPSRYDHQLAMFGQALVDKLRNSRTFMVGCGALGCEYLKNFAMMGLATGPAGVIQVTDNDRIEVSNLNRQFLFRSHNVGQMKSEAAKESVLQMNPDLKINSRTDLVAPNTTHIFNDDFWLSLDFVTNALDNVFARQFVDTKCVAYGLPLLESGTQGTKCNSQVVIPHQTVSYNDGPKDNEQGGIPMCTLRNFPNLITHCVEWARATFSDVFDAPFADAKKLVANRDQYLEEILEEAQSKPKEKANELAALLRIFEKAKNITFEGCVEEAWQLLHKMHRDKILDLVHQYPENCKDKSGAPFWSGHKRFPRAVQWNPSDMMVTSYVVATANILAVCYGIQPPPLEQSAWVASSSPWRKPEYVAKCLHGKKYPAWKFSGEKAAADEDDLKAEAQASAQSADEDIQMVKKIAQTLRTLDVSKCKFEPADFEKDCDANFHIDFIFAATNLRAWNYQLETKTRDEVKVIAGRIIPAILTATSAITGLMCIEVYKLVQKKKFDAFRDSSNNLGTNNYAFSEPTEVMKHYERTEAQRKVDSTRKFIASEKERKEGPRLDKLATFNTRLDTALADLKAAKQAVPEGFTKWDQIRVQAHPALTVHEAVNEFVKAIKDVDCVVSSLRIGSFTLFDQAFEKSFEEVAPGLVHRLKNSSEHPFLRESVVRVLEAHEAGKANNSRWRAVPIRDAAAVALGGEKSGATRLCLVNVSFSTPSDRELLCPQGVLEFKEGEGASREPCRAAIEAATAANTSPSGKMQKPSKLTGLALERVLKELSGMAKQPLPGVALLSGQDPQHCEGVVIGPEGTPYAGGVFKLSYTFPESYPDKPPVVVFKTPVFHCNVDQSGHLCGIPILKDAWSPAFKAGDVLLAIKTLLMTPNWDEPLQVDIAKLHEKDALEHDKRAQQLTQEQAMPQINFDESKYAHLAVTDVSTVAASFGSEQKDDTPCAILTDEQVAAAIKPLLQEFVDDMGNVSEVIASTNLQPERRARYAELFPQLKDPQAGVISVRTSGGDHIVVVPDGAPAELVVLEDAITLEDLSPTALVEYRFGPEDNWQLGSLSQDSLDQYKAIKFSQWEGNIKKMMTDCIAAFLRMIKVGLVCNIFDPTIFKEPASEKDKWQVIDKSGTVRHIVHPVHELRIWNSSTQNYDSLSPRLEGGAPKPEEEDAYWREMLAKLDKEAQALFLGKDFVSDCVNLDPEVVKEKYKSCF